ncbi:6-phospho-3-hexuloisomerase [Methanosphaera sp. BMS]|uniref:6-phospho-3-hexuloisomerase n=1 Tax=Methanosphaera sp. BMS TaxID=1789762 RepID=UPI000DC1D493|nr:6-phospho-3-hexuloisomerase [Methanosphaera sp. BMS]AWX32666.1 6-phospho 3-hexuloisomerase [Methanosphaera sp. BMS]
MVYYDAVNEIISNVKKSTQEVNQDDLKEMINTIKEADSIFVMGLGRSGLVAKAFAMRLMHLGLNVYVVGETITPAITEKDCLIAISGSGETSYILSTTDTAIDIGSKIIAITSYPESSLGKKSDVVVEVKGRTKNENEPSYIKRQISGQHQTLSPLGTLFEISALVFLDSTIAQLMYEYGLTEKDLKARHTVLE